MKTTKLLTNKVPPVIEVMITAAHNVLALLGDLEGSGEIGAYGRRISAQADKLCGALNQLKSYRDHVNRDSLVTLNLHSHGDPSVGIQPTDIYVNLYSGLVEEEDMRNDLRSELLLCLKDWLDDRNPIGTYSFECPDCGTILDEKGKCPHQQKHY